MQHYQVPSAETSSYINHVVSLGLADDYTAQLRASCSPNSPPALRAAIDQACRHLSGVVNDLQPVPASAPGVHSLDTLGQQNGAPVSDAAVGLAAAMPNTPEEEARIPQLTQLINARQGAAKPQNTVQAEKSAAKLWRRYCEQEAHRYPDGDLMSQAKILEFSMWLVDEAVQQNVITYATSRKSAESSTHRAASPQMYLHPWISRQSGDLLRARGMEMQAENLNAQVAAQVDAALSAGQLRQSLQTAFQQKQWRWAYLLRMAMTFMPATLGRSDDLRKLPWSCLALRTQDNVSPVPSVAILFGSMQGKTVKPGQVDIPGVVRYRDHRICPQAALADLAVATFHRGIKLEDLAKFINASLRIDSYGDQWLRTIPPAASRLLRSAVGKQLRQETWDKHVAAEAVLSDNNLLFTNPTAFFFKTLGGKEATPLALVVPLSSVQPPASVKPIPWLPLASQASYGVTLPPQSLSALSASDERDSFLLEKQVWKLSEFQTVPEAFEAFSKISAVPSDFRRWHGSKKEARASSTAFSRFKNGLAAEAWMPWEAPWLLLSGLQKWNQLCGKYSSDSKLLGKPSASSYSCFVMQLLSVWVLLRVCQEVPPLAVNSAPLHVRHEVSRWSLKWWQAGQRNGMVASENRGAVRRQLIDFFHDNFRSIITQERMPEDDILVVVLGVQLIQQLLGGLTLPRLGLAAAVQAA
eukprot:jgi/Astpho2/4214/Aster-05178